LKISSTNEEEKLWDGLCAVNTPHGFLQLQNYQLSRLVELAKNCMDQKH
jgi:hypothetical protein